MAKNNVQSVSYLLYTQVIKPQIIQKPQDQSWHKPTYNNESDDNYYGNANDDDDDNGDHMIAQ